jgi:hypothetical protein
MSIPVELEARFEHERVKVEAHQDNGDVGLKVFNEPLRQRDVRFGFAVSNTLGVEMAVDASFSGTPILVHNGIDSVAWTASSISGGKFTFDSTDQAFAGTKSIKTDNGSLGDTMEINNGSSIDLSTHIAMSLHIYVDKDWSANDSISIYGWDSVGGVQVGDLVLLENYFSFSQFDIWHNLAIPFEDMNLEDESIDSFRIEIISKSGKSPKYYIDNFDIQEFGGEELFNVTSPGNKKFEVNNLTFTFIDALDTTLLNGTMSNLSYDKFLGVSKLSKGIGLDVVRDNKIQFTTRSTCLADYMRGGGKIENMMCDGTNTALNVSIDFDSPIVLDPRTEDRIIVSIGDDLSGLISLFMVAKGNVRDL